MWAAHSLRTDQVALGDSVLKAYVAMKRVMRVFWEAVGQDPSILLEPAPKDVCDMLKDAKPLEQAFLARAGQLLRRREVPRPTGKIFKALDLESLGTATSTSG